VQITLLDRFVQLFSHSSFHKERRSFTKVSDQNYQILVMVKYLSSNICAMDKLSRVSSVRMSSVDRTAIMKLNRIEPRELVHHEHFATFKIALAERK